jgi:hypothetical protein
VQNSTASGSRGELVPSFMPEENKPVLEANVVFQSIVSGDLMGKVTQVTLTNDGVMTQLISAPNIRSRPVVVKRLSQQQLKQFQQMLEARQFRNLNDLELSHQCCVCRLSNHHAASIREHGSIY